MCKKLSECDSLKWMNKQGDRFGQSRVEIESKLKNANCGNENGEMKVQCPETQIIGLFNISKLSFFKYNLVFINVGSVRLLGFAVINLESAKY
jgi:hypothetical protein